ncbi:MAG: histidine triad nucleotide-binding protein [Oscillospiraceae bacterium]|nr:histidine triad nucleotide-binding protein [Oscillospiraceae bacterium]
MDCLFCKIIRGEIPSTVVYETDELVAIRDIAPQAPFHVIIIPKQHIPSPAHITEENSHIAGKMILAAAEIAKQEKLENGYRIVANCGEDGGQTVGHIHFHMLAQRNLSWPPG